LTYLPHQLNLTIHTIPLKQTQRPVDLALLRQRRPLILLLRSQVQPQSPPNPVYDPPTALSHALAQSPPPRSLVLVRSKGKMAKISLATPVHRTLHLLSPGHAPSRKYLGHPWTPVIQIVDVFQDGFG